MLCWCSDYRYDAGQSDDDDERATFDAPDHAVSLTHQNLPNVMLILEAYLDWDHLQGRSQNITSRIV